MPDPFRPCFALSIRMGDATRGEPMMVFGTAICPATAETCPGVDACHYSENGRYLHERVYEGLARTLPRRRTLPAQIPRN